MRMRRKPWAQQELDDNPYVVNNPEDNKGIWSGVFGNDFPIRVEVGSGKGRFITENAKAYPDANFIGIEKQVSVCAIAARAITQIRQDGAGDNIRLIHGDGGLLQSMFSAGEIDELYINFCDPWPKARSAKRRLTHRRFLEVYRTLLRPGGKIVLKTDNRTLFQFSLNEFLECGFFIRNASLDLHNDERILQKCGNIMTEYEEKFSSQGMEIYRLEAKTSPVE